MTAARKRGIEKMKWGEGAMQLVRSCLTIGREKQQRKKKMPRVLGSIRFRENIQERKRKSWAFLSEASKL